MGESIFLAFVVPRPKAALSWFVPGGGLQVRNVRGYFRIIGRIMAKRGLTAPDSGAYGFYDVRLREGLRRELPPVDTLMQSDSLMVDPIDPDIDADGDGAGIGNFFRRLFKGNRDRTTEEQQPTVQPETPPTDAAAPTDTVKTRKQLRQERRERKRREREAQQVNELNE